MPVYLEKVLRHAERELVHQSHLRPTDLLDIYRRFLKLEEHRLRLEHMHGEGGGRELAQRRADVISVMLSHIWSAAWDTHRKSHFEQAPRITLLAVGGFGRGELNPYSDIDILFLHANESKNAAQVNDIVQHVLYMLWDIGFQVGHATRSMSELVGQANGDLRTKTSLLEARSLCGDEPLFHEFEKTFQRRCLQGYEKEFLEWRLADQKDRHEKAGNTVFLQEPNVKNGCGGLRDYQNLLWIGKVKRGLETTQQMVDAQLLTPTERKQLDRAYDFLLRVRTELHYQQKRAGDVLTLRLQGEIAESFRYQHRTVLRKMEAFMRDYYAHSSLLYNLGNTLSRRLCGGGKPVRWAFLPFRATRREEFDGFILENGELEASSNSIFSEEPLRLARVFLLAQQHQAELGAELKLRLRRRLYQVDRNFIYQTAVKETLLAILSRKGQVGRILRSMHEMGYLGRFFPEFRPLTCLVQHEFFHRYTADEHTLVCIEVLDKIIDAKETPFSKYTPLLQDVSRPHILYLAMLLHDTGKSDNAKRHAEASAANAVRVARRMRIKGADLSILVFLVDHHLTMSEIARRKNLDNEQTIIEFARVVQTQERLDLLMLLTFADTHGTGSGRTYSDWKDLLLWQLYQRTTAALSGVTEFVAMAEQAREETRQRLLKNLDRQFDPGEIEAHFENLPPSYFEMVPEDLIREHISIVHGFLKYQLTHEAALQPVIHWRHFPDQGHSEVTVVTWDRDYIFARVTGAFSACNLSILKADIFTRTDDIAIETFFVATEKLEAVTDPRDRDAFEKILFQAMSMEEFDFAKAFARRSAKPRIPAYELSQIPTKVVVDLDASDSYALLDVQTADYPGLLYRIACALAETGLNLVSARVTTEKGAALDTFAFTDRDGNKITSEKVLRELTQTVRERIVA